MIALVPVKTLSRAKTRLAGALDSGARAKLMHDTLRRTLQALKQVEAIGEVVVITRDDEVNRWATEWGAQVIRERGEGLNEALRQARDAYKDADALLAVPADLGWPAVEDLQAMIALAGDEGGQPGNQTRRQTQSVIIAPDRHESGTNALLLRPPGVIDFAFGPDSAARHAALATEKGITPILYRSASLSLDVDEPEDLALYEAAPYVL
jgi:2-phospho-L-lactate guanylyltransferase